ncbi:MAG: OmpA family protein [Chitinophagaceae bacterium]|nr:OmpA family protein [Chitinophagaceae bacterium]
MLCLSGSVVWAQGKPQNKVEKKKGMLSYSINYSDYGFAKIAKDSSISAAFNRKGLFKSGNSSFGFGLSYWKGLGSHVDFSGNLAGTFSNFPRLFVKGDSIGKASFTPQLDVMLHARAFKDQRKINPFLTAGIGAGYFGKQLAVYAPLGVGLQFHLNRTFIFVQAQWRLAITDGISNDYMFYSIGIGQQKKVKKEEKKPETEIKTEPVVDSTKKAESNELDTDGDGVPDIRDNCPTEAGTAIGCPDADGDGIADKDDQCKDVKGDPRYKGCPVPDTDGDGVNDDDDKCKTVFGLVENSGCPAAADENGDDDNDGVRNKDDKCPDKAGTAANDGCPMEIVKGGQLLRVSGDSMTYYIRFDFDKANITADAFSALSQVVKILKADKTLSINIEGHADRFGQEIYNEQISSERANVARDYLLSYGIARNRITTAFYGSTRPYDIHQDWLNRRVEITLYKK